MVVSFGASVYLRKGIDRLETQTRQHQVTVKKKIEDETRAGVLLTALANGNELQKKLCEHLALNAYRVEPFAEMVLENQ